MPKYNTILVAVDQNESACGLIGEANDLAKQIGADLHVAHIFRPLDYTYVSALTMGSLNADTGNFQEDAIKQAEKSLREKITGTGISNEKIHLAIGYPADEVPELARKIGAELIVIGKHDKKQGILSMIGSTARGIVNQATCDVLTLKVPQTESD